MSGFLAPVAISARHVHLSRDDRIALFFNTELKKLRDLSQPGQYATTETVTISTDFGSIEGVRVLGPDRAETQVEVSATDARTLKLDAPIRLSGDLEGTPGLTITAKNGKSIRIKRGVIVAARHLHLSSAEAGEFGVGDGQVVAARFTSDLRSGTLENIVVRVADDFTIDLHVDTDEGNAVGVVPGARAEVFL